MIKSRKFDDAAIVYDQGALSGDAASRDVVEQMRAVEEVLRSHGVVATRIGVDLDLASFKSRLEAVESDVVYNLVESLDGSDRMQTVVAMALENWGIPFTGCGSTAMLLSNDKVETKRLLHASGIDVAEAAWVDARGELHAFPNNDWCVSGCTCIIKAVESHASLHLDDGSVLRGTGPVGMAGALRMARIRHGDRFFAERFIEGREFNISVIETADGYEVLPAAEISFSAVPDGRERIVGYAAKWDEDSAEYAATPRTFDIDDQSLCQALCRDAGIVWERLGFTGYGRVDFRVGSDGRRYVLEANSNPCLHPGSGFAAAAERAGIAYDALIMRLGRLARKQR